MTGSPRASRNTHLRLVRPKKGSAADRAIRASSAIAPAAGRACTLGVSGELDIATTADLTQRAATALLFPAERLILDLSGLRFIDCCGVRALAAVTRAAPAGCPVLVRGADRRARRILDLLDLPLDRRGTVTPERVEWLLLESQVLVSWAEEACASSRALAAQARRARSRRAAGRQVSGG